MMAAPSSEARHEVVSRAASETGYSPAGHCGLQLVAEKWVLKRRLGRRAVTISACLSADHRCYRLADLRTLVRASSGSSRIWPTIRWAGSSIRSRFRSRISLARWSRPACRGRWTATYRIGGSCRPVAVCGGRGGRRGGRRSGFGVRRMASSSPSGRSTRRPVRSGALVLSDTASGAGRSRSGSVRLDRRTGTASAEPRLVVAVEHGLFAE